MIHTSEVSHLNVDFFLFLFKVKNDNLSGRAANKQHLGGAAESDLLHSELRVVTEWIVRADLQSQQPVQLN